MFYYKKGNVVCRTPFNRPSIKVFNKWLDEFKRLPGLNNYNLYLTGAFCQNYFLNKNIKTWDIDVIITSKNKVSIDYPVLRNILIESIRIGFRNNLLIDSRYLKNPPEFDQFTWSEEKIVTYKEIIVKSNGLSKTHKIDTKEIIPGLYLNNKKTKKGYDKFIFKVNNLGYELACKKLDI